MQALKWMKLTAPQANARMAVEIHLSSDLYRVLSLELIPFQQTDPAAALILCADGVSHTCPPKGKSEMLLPNPLLNHLFLEVFPAQRQVFLAFGEDHLCEKCCCTPSPRARGYQTVWNGALRGVPFHSVGVKRRSFYNRLQPTVSVQPDGQWFQSTAWTWKGSLFGSSAITVEPHRLVSTYSDPYLVWTSSSWRKSKAMAGSGLKHLNWFQA
jgi:hypothetical protein